jgi:hypothetical protein
MKSCKDCRLYNKVNRVCVVEVTERADTISGIKTYYVAKYAYTARSLTGLCGPEAKLFDPKPSILQKLKQMYTELE